MKTQERARDPGDIDHVAALVRAYVPSLSADKKTIRKNTCAQRESHPSKWVLIFDTETTTDETQALRFGTYQLRRDRKLIEKGIFFDPAGITPEELLLLETVSAGHDANLMTRCEFVDEVFFGKAYEMRATFVGFNLPFDISRLALRCGPARGKMKGGFTFQLSGDARRARVQIRHLNSRAAFIQFALPPKQRTSRGMRKRGLWTPPRRGTFVDLRTIGSALFSQSFSLKTLAEHLQTGSRKFEAGSHGTKLTEKYATYALQDVEVTWECFDALDRKFAEHGLTRTNIGKIQSEASLGKAYLREMGLKTFRELQPDFPAHLLGKIMSTYFGGRSEVRWRRVVKQVLYCDFISMYPTVCTLMGLWRFVVAKGISWVDSTDATQQLLERITLPDLKNPRTWRLLATIVELSPNSDVLPLRAKYAAVSATIGVNVVTSERSLWYTLADVIVSKLITGRTPIISAAFSFEPRHAQGGLRSVQVAGRRNCQIDPVQDDFYKCLIDLRTEVKDKLHSAAPGERPHLQAEQQALKILANSTSYGIFVEVNVSDFDQFQTRTCYGPSGEGFSVQTKKGEGPGSFFHPLIATLITGAARLMLGISETLALQANLDWAFCDTDSMAFAKPDGMPSEDLIEKAKAVVGWFKDLNPYKKPGSLLKIEDENFGQDKQLQPLYTLCISSKRYALFNIDGSNTPIIRKASAHGLGHMLAPYSDGAKSAKIAPPKHPLATMNVDFWQYELWVQIVSSTLNGQPDEVDLTYHPDLTLVSLRRGPSCARVVWRNA